METANNQISILRRPEVCKITGLSYTSIWRLEKAKQFPARLRLQQNSVGWIAAEVDAWLRERVRGGRSAVQPCAVQQ